MQQLNLPVHLEDFSEEDTRNHTTTIVIYDSNHEKGSSPAKGSVTAVYIQSLNQFSTENRISHQLSLLSSFDTSAGTTNDDTDWWCSERKIRNEKEF